MNISFNDYVDTLKRSRSECCLEYSNRDKLIGAALNVLGDAADNPILAIIYSTENGNIVNGYSTTVFVEWLAFVRSLSPTGTFAIITEKFVNVYYLKNLVRLNLSDGDSSYSIVKKTLLDATVSFKETPLLELFKETFPIRPCLGCYFLDPNLGPLEFDSYVSSSLNYMPPNTSGKLYDRPVTLSLTDKGLRHWVYSEDGDKHGQLVADLNELESNLAKFKALIKHPVLLEHLRKELIG